ncbi:MAG: DNA mismatch repair endonuclease MutL [Psychrobacter sp.]|nr:DNA mismatch repair endonuclease MutL [Psychrobacter sp.]
MLSFNTTHTSTDAADTVCSSRIKKLPPLLINQLAAGEIVTRPAAVVKELLENAIDAGATQIEIKVTRGGMGMIEVSDNGCGIHPDDMVMAVTRHATSKIADVANLQGIRTLGFRGEALASTAAVSRLTLSSSNDDSGIGRQLTVAGILEDTPVLMPIVHDKGTTVLVKDLYFNVPARRGNLKSVATEFTHIESVVREVALAYADVSLTLYHDYKKRLVLLANNASLNSGGHNSHNDNYSINHGYSTDSSDSAYIVSSEGRLPLSRLEQALGISLLSGNMPLYVDLSVLLEADALATEDFAATRHSAIDYSNTKHFDKTDDNTSLYNDLNYPNINASSLESMANDAKGDIRGDETTDQTHLPSFEDNDKHFEATSANGLAQLQLPHIEGWLWAVSGDKVTLPKLIYVNGRLIKDQVIASHLRQTMQNATGAFYHELSTPNLGYALYFQLPTHWLNVNVHPSKQRIKIYTLANIMAHLDYAVKAALKQAVKSLPDNPIEINPVAAAQLYQASYSANVDSTTTLNSFIPKKLKATAQANTVTEKPLSYQLSKPAFQSIPSAFQASQPAANLSEDRDNTAHQLFDKRALSVKDGNFLRLIPGPSSLVLESIEEPLLLQILEQTLPSHDSCIDAVIKTGDDTLINHVDSDRYNPMTRLVLLYWGHHHFLIPIPSLLEMLLLTDEYPLKKVSLLTLAQLKMHLRNYWDNNNQVNQRQQLFDYIQARAIATITANQLIQLMLNQGLAPSSATTAQSGNHYSNQKEGQSGHQKSARLNAQNSTQISVQNKDELGNKDE